MGRADPPAPARVQGPDRGGGTSRDRADPGVRQRPPGRCRPGDRGPDPGWTRPSSARRAGSGRTAGGQREVVAKVIQRRPSSPDGTDAGATLIIDEAGGLQYVIAKATGSRRRRLPLLPKPRAARDRDHRPLKVFAFDPSRGRRLGNSMTITMPLEKLAPGPIGGRFAVIDYDAPRTIFYAPVDLDDPRS